VGQDVAPYTDMPLWIPPAAGSLGMPIDRAVDAGLRSRPLADTVADTRAWTARRGAPPPPQESGGRVRVPAGMPREREAELLRLWRDRTPARP
jgi:hypothetical protein